MSTMARVLFLVLAFAVASQGADTQTGFFSSSAVQKVIQMLQDMLATAKKEKNEEEVSYAGFSQFCTNKQGSLKNEIATGAEQIELMTTSIEKLDVEIHELAKGIDELQRSVASNEGEMKGQTTQREADNKDYAEQSTDLSESIDALERAIAVLNKQNYDRTQAADALIQVESNPRIPQSAKLAIAEFHKSGAASGNFLQQAHQQDQDDDDSDFAPEANAYEFQSGNIIDLLKKLLDDFRKQKKAADKEEMNSKHAYDMIMQDLTDSVEEANADIASKSVDKEQKAEKAAQTKQELAFTTKDHAEDVKALSELEAECSEKGASFKEKQELRANEIAALQKAVEILSSAAVSGAADKHLALKQVGAALVQLSASSVGAGTQTEEGIRHRLLDFLRSEQERLHSQRLGLLVSKVEADPFAKVKKLIDEMITRLLEEANQEAEQKGFCDKELGTNKVTRNKLQSEIDVLSANIDEATAAIEQLATDITKLSKEVAELDASMEEATKMRQAEKEKNTLTIKDAADAQTAIASAKAVLEEFYKSAAQATALLQTPKMGSEEWDALANPNFKGTVDKGHKAGQQTFGDTYTGQQDEAGGVLAMLEVISSDFANLESETKANEIQSQQVYGDFMAESNKSKAVKQKNIEMFTADKTETESKLITDKQDLANTQDQLLAADRYYEKLKPQCIDSGMTFDERQKARESEIQSLKEALKILSGDAIA